MSRASHGDGRKMTVEEAVAQRARMIAVWGPLSTLWYRTSVFVDARATASRPCCGHRHDRQWTDYVCYRAGICQTETPAAEDVGLVDGVPVAMCSACRTRVERGRSAA